MIYTSLLNSIRERLEERDKEVNKWRVLESVMEWPKMTINSHNQYMLATMGAEIKTVQANDISVEAFNLVRKFNLKREWINL